MDFDLNDKVIVGERVAGNEKGIVTGRAEYCDRPPTYFVNYVDGTGCYRGDWFNAADLSGDNE